MEYRTLDWYQEFHCIGGSCEDSCCENWEIDLDEESLRLYMKQKGDFGKRLKDSTRVKDKQFILSGTRCPFLNEDNLCDIYINMGEDCLCETCTNFPRHIEEFDDLKEVSLTMSCPEASRIMLAKEEKMHFVCKEGTDKEYGLKMVRPVKSFAFWKKQSVNKLDNALFDALFEVRERMFAILQNRELPIRYRACIILMLAEDVQEVIDKGEKNYSQIAQILQKLPDSVNAQKEYVETRKALVRQPEEKVAAWLLQILNMYEGLETIKEEWRLLLEKGQHFTDLSGYPAFMEYYKQREYEFEHILVYYIYNYFLGASYDRDALTKVKFAIISYLVVFHLDVAYWMEQDKCFTYENQVLVAHAYSKEVEHSYNNFESLQLVLAAHPLLAKEHLLSALLLF